MHPHAIESKCGLRRSWCPHNGGDERLRRWHATVLYVYTATINTGTAVICNATDEASINGQWCA